jgi:hypothetical protein
MPKKSDSIQDRKKEPLKLSEEEEKLLAQHGNLKLQIELVPRSCWLANVRRNVTQTQWNKIRNPVYEAANNRCEICGEQGERYAVDCHEVWFYNDTTLTQELEFFQALCPMCHEVKHIGFAGIRGNGERAFDRFMRINELDEERAREIKRTVFKQWKIRSKQSWKLNIELLKEYGLDPAELQDRGQRKRK